MKKTKTLLSLFLCLVMAIGLLPFAAAPAYALVDGDWEYTLNESEEACITKYTGSETAVQVPFILGGYPGYTVTSIGEKAFFENTTIVSVAIPAEVTEIGDYAFNGCTALKTVTLNEGLKHIGHYAFGRDQMLSGIAIPATVTSIGVSAFYGCQSLSSMAFPEGLKTIAGNTFQLCGNLRSVVIPKSVTLIALNAFESCTQLQKVYYNGSEADKAGINIVAGSGNAPLSSATWIYYAPTLEEPVATSASVKLSWNAVTDATKYMMYRRDFNGSTWSGWTVKTKNITGTTWTDSSVTVGGQYEYKVRACVGNVFRGYSNVVNATVPVPAGAPMLSGAAQAGKNVLSWGAVSGATKYMMYRREYNGSTWGSWEIKSKSITGTSWTDSNVTAGNTYEYKARAYVGTAFGPYSNVVSLTAKAAATPPTLNGTAQAGKNVLNWTAVSGATRYMMYRREYNGSTWGSWEIKSKSLTGNTWTDSNVTAGNTYEYKMRACVDGVFGGYSNVVSLTAKAALPTATLSGIAQAGKNELNWTAVSGATKYMMCRREYSGGVWGSWEIKSKSLTGTGWTDTGVSGGCTYEYKLRACVDGVFGGYSNVVSLTQQPTATIYGEAMYQQNELAWTYVPGATAYKVYRRVNSGSGWSSWTNVKTLYETNWSDTAVTELYQYQYRVRARVGGEYGGYSNIVELNSPGAPDTDNPILAGDLELTYSGTFPEDMCWTAHASCTMPLQYRFWIFLNGNIVFDSGYMGQNFCKGEHGMELGGPYTARVFLKNSSNDVVSMDSTVYVFCDGA